MGDSVDNKSDSIRFDLKEFRFGSIQFIGCGILARGQIVMGAAAKRKFLTVEKLSDLLVGKRYFKNAKFGAENLRSKEILEEMLNVEHP